MIRENIRQLLEELPSDVLLEAAAKRRTPQEVLEAVAAGVQIIGENYVQDAQEARRVVGQEARLHMIGHLQRNKVKRAVEVFDMIETVDSIRLAQEIEKRCAPSGKTMPTLIEINSGHEPQKSGVLPERIEEFLERFAELRHLNVQGLMTMGPRFGDPERARPYFHETKRLFDQLKCFAAANVEMRYLSMGMSNSYRIAIQEGANIIRIGTMIFGSRDDSNP